MDTIFDIILYTVPLVITLIIVWVVAGYFLKHQRNQWQHEKQMRSHTDMLPLQLQAYERLALFMERISVDSLLVREQQSEGSTRDLHQHLLAVIRSEFEHNLSQQIYVSDEVWEAVKNAKERVIKMIHSAAVKVNPEGKALELSKKIIDLQMEIEVSPTRYPLDLIRQEVRKLTGTDH